MTLQKADVRRAQNFMQQMESIPSIVTRLKVPKDVPCPTCLKKDTLKLDDEQPKTTHTLGIDLNYRCTSCGNKVETKVEF